MDRPCKLGTRTRHCSLLVQNAVFCEECFGKNRALYADLTYKDVDCFLKGSVHEVYCLKASQVCKISRSKCSREKTVTLSDGSKTPPEVTFKKDAHCARLIRRLTGVTSRREREFLNVGVVYKT